MRGFSGFYRAVYFLAFIVNLTALVGFSFSAYAGSIAVIVNSANPVNNLGESGIRKIYTNNILRWPDGMPITIYDLDVNDPLREEFSMKILGKPPYRVAEQWAHLKISNQAMNPPHNVKSQRYIIQKVSRERGAIGYVLLSTVKDNPNVRVIRTIE